AGSSGSRSSAGYAAGRRRRPSTNFVRRGVAVGSRRRPVTTSSRNYHFGPELQSMAVSSSKARDARLATLPLEPSRKIPSAAFKVAGLACHPALDFVEETLLL